MYKRYILLFALLCSPAQANYSEYAPEPVVISIYDCDRFVMNFIVTDYDLNTVSKEASDFIINNGRIVDHENGYEFHAFFLDKITGRKCGDR